MRRFQTFRLAPRNGEADPERTLVPVARPGMPRLRSLERDREGRDLWSGIRSFILAPSGLAAADLLSAQCDINPSAKLVHMTATITAPI